MERPMRIFDRPPFNLCAQCGAALIAPTSAEHLDDRHVRNLWTCEACGYQFKTSMYFPVPEREARASAVVRCWDAPLNTTSQSKESQMRYKPKCTAALQL